MDKTPLVIQADAGIRLNLSNYCRIRTWQGGGEFWEHHNQQLIRDALGQFLPRATVESGNSVLFQHYEAGKEICSLSQPVTAAEPLPRVQVDQLVAALTAFKAKAADPQCDPDAKKLIDCFRLPDPKKDPELYRIHGTGKNRRLVVLWGAEKEQDSAVAPLEAINMVHSEPARQNKRSGRPMLAAALLVALAILGWFLWQRDKDGSGQTTRSSSVGHASSNSDKPAPEPVPVVGRGAVAPSGSSSMGDRNTAAAVLPGDAREDVAVDSGSDSGLGNAAGDAPAGHPAATNTASDASVPKPGLAPTAATGKEAATTREATIAKIQSGKTEEGGFQADAATPLLGVSEESAAAKLDGANPPVADPGIEPTHPPGDATAAIPPEEATPSQTDIRSPAAGNFTPRKDGKGSDTPLGSVTNAKLTATEIAIEETIPAEQPGSVDPKDDPARDGSAATGPSNPVDAGELPGAGTGVLEIIKAEVGEEPRDGKVEVLLGLRGSDGNKGELQVSSATWKVDGVTIKQQDGSPLQAQAVKRWLPVGKHTVEVVGRAGDGSEMRAEAELDVRIKQRPTPEVDLRSKPPKPDN